MCLAVFGAGSIAGHAVAASHVDLASRDIARVDPQALSVAGLARRFRLPHDARQGPADWYVLEARLQIRVVRPTRTSTAVISLSTNGRTSLQFEVTVPAAGSALPVEWNVYGLVDGLVRRSVTDTSVTLVGRNYLQYMGVRGGENMLSVTVEPVGEQVVTQASLLPGTRIVAGKRGPAMLRVAARPVRPGVGGLSQYRVIAANVGGRSERDVTLRVEQHGRAVWTRKVGILAPRSQQVWTVPAADLDGGARLVARGATSSHAVGLGLAVAADSRTGGGAPSAWWLLAAASLLGSGLVTAWRTRK